MSKKNESAGFEKDLERLEAILETLQSGELGLEETLKSFEEGVKLYKSCQVSLQAVEKKVKVLLEDLSEKDFSE
jgi:exodeoxyribonuclease VII small subunit